MSDIPVDVVVSSEDSVGESPHWDPDKQSLAWVDILGRRIAQWHSPSGSARNWPAPDYPTAIARCRDGRHAIVALARSVALFDYQGGFEWFAEPEPERVDNRLNEGGCDPDGNFWVGSMQTNLALDGSLREMSVASGALYRIDPSGTVHRATPSAFGITNTLAWDTERERLLTADTLRNEIYAYRWDRANSTLGEARVWARGPERGSPDGSCLDAEGYLWNARSGSGCLIRFAPDGTVDRTVELPVSNPTACTFGGEEMDTLFVTSGRIGLSAEQLAKNPAEGALLALKPGVTGPRQPAFALP